ncbi:uncharacterized protein DEA37_0013583 [Paragonimus westermani]|uniref:Rhodanese domain-containing protein n=1 Tax=Paragonimus westermani TaxID=34504 RepID=A0A5J4NTB2_9TREM|nr:uncharacterized protein DEA37_0013583 [Paragonimus westermani]
MMAVRFPVLRFYIRTASTFVSGTRTYSYDLRCLPRRHFSIKHQNVESHKDKFPENLCGKRSINYYELSALLNEYSVFLIDVRGADDFAQIGHIPGAINIPREYALLSIHFDLVAELKTALTLPDEVFAKKYGVKKPRHSDENIVFYGLSDVLSSAANEIAHGLGYKKYCAVQFLLFVGQNFIRRDGPGGPPCCRDCNSPLRMTWKICSIFAAKNAFPLSIPTEHLPCFVYALHVPCKFPVVYGYTSGLIF